MLGIRICQDSFGVSANGRGFACHLSQTEIQNLGVTAPGDKDVRRLDVAVNNALAMGCVERVRYVDRYRKKRFRFQWPPGDSMAQGHAIQKLHDDEGLAFFLPDFMDRADVGMVQTRGRLSLALEAQHGLRVVGYFLRQKLQGDEAVQVDVLGLVDDAHATAAELLNDAVMRNDLVKHGRIAGLQINPCYGRGICQSTDNESDEPDQWFSRLSTTGPPCDRSSAGDWTFPGALRYCFFLCPWIWVTKLKLCEGPCQEGL